MQKFPASIALVLVMVIVQTVNFIMITFVSSGEIRRTYSTF